MRAGRSLVAPALLALVGVLALGGCSGAGAPVGAPTPLSGTPSPTSSALDGCLPADEGTRFQLQVEGRTIGGAVLGGGPRAVVLSNQSDAGLCGWLPEGRRLAGLGYRVVLWDQDAVDWATAIAAIVADQRAQGATRVALMGASKGGWASSIAAGTVQPRVDGLVSLSGEGELRGRTVYAELGRYRGPVLVISATGDDFAADTLTTFPKVHAHGPTTVLPLKGSDHGWALLGDDHAATVRAAIDAFLARALGAA